MTTAVTLVDTVVEKSRARFAPILANSEVGLEPFLLGVRSALLSNDKLMVAARDNPQSLVTALNQAAQLGLSPEPKLQHFSLVPFKGEITPIVGYRGYMWLAELSGVVEDIGSMVVYRDEFERLREDGLRIIDRKTGELNLDEEDRILAADEGGVNTSDGQIVAAVAWCRIKGVDRQKSILLTREQIEKRRQCGQGNTPAWRNWYAEQCKKTALRALLTSGRVRLGAHGRLLEAALERDEQSAGSADGGEVIRHVEATVVQPDPTPSIEELDHARREDNPLPSDDDRKAELTSDIWSMAERGDIDSDTVVGWCQDRHGCSVEDAGVEALEDVRRALEAGEIQPEAVAAVQEKFGEAEA